MSRRLAVFGYGSLVDPRSAAETLGRPIARPVPARLAGHVRTWTLGRDNLRSEKTFARPDGSLPRFCLGLNLEPNERSAAPNGALIEVTEAELERLDLREMRYDRVEVTEAVTGPDAPAAGFDSVFAYRARPEHHHPAPPAGAVLLASYVRAVEAAFARLGDGELTLYRRTTRAVAIETIEATLVRDRIPPGNPRAW